MWGRSSESGRVGSSRALLLLQRILPGFLRTGVNAACLGLKSLWDCLFQCLVKSPICVMSFLVIDVTNNGSQSFF